MLRLSAICSLLAYVAAQGSVTYDGGSHIRYQGATRDLSINSDGNQPDGSPAGNRLWNSFDYGRASRAATGNFSVNVLPQPIYDYPGNNSTPWADNSYNFPPSQPAPSRYDPNRLRQPDTMPSSLPSFPNQFPQREPTPYPDDSNRFPQSGPTPSPYYPNRYPQSDPTPSRYDHNRDPQPDPRLSNCNPNRSLQLDSTPRPYEPKQLPQSDYTPSPYIPNSTPQPDSTPKPYDSNRFPQPDPTPNPYNPDKYPQTYPILCTNNSNCFPQPDSTPNPYDPNRSPQPNVTPSPYDSYQFPQPGTSPSSYDPNQLPQPGTTPRPYVPNQCPQSGTTPSHYDSNQFPQPDTTPSPYDSYRFSQPGTTSSLYDSKWYPLPNPTPGPYDPNWLPQSDPTSRSSDNNKFLQPDPTQSSYDPNRLLPPGLTLGSYNQPISFAEPIPPQTQTPQKSDPYPLPVPAPEPRYISSPKATSSYPDLDTAHPSRPGPYPRPSSQPARTMVNPQLPVTLNLTRFSCDHGDGYYGIVDECEAYVDCQGSIARKKICPGGLHFNPKASYTQNPCANPSEVECRKGALNQDPRSSFVCPKQNGTVVYPSPDGDCNWYIMCEGRRATRRPCSAGLVFNELLRVCDWPENVPQCNPDVFKNFTCPKPPPNAEEYTFKYKYGNECKYYVACQRGFPRLLSCDEGTSFDVETKTCVNSNRVKGCESVVVR